MQDETTIPEDIFDQRHLQEIEEKEQNNNNIKSNIGIGAKGRESVDIIDVNLPYDDSDADAEADIILESQRSSERNFNSSDDTNNNGDEANSPGIVYMTQVRPGHVDGVTKVDNLRKTFNKKDIFKETKKKPKTKFNSDGKQSWNQQPDVKYESTSPRYTYDFPETDLSSFTAMDNYEDAIDDDEEDDDDGSAEYERFKYMHEKKLREQKEREEQQQREQQKQQLQQKLHHQQQETSAAATTDVDNKEEGGRGQMSLIKKLNERKFNKPSLNENEKLSTKDENDQRENDHHHGDDADNGSYDSSSISTDNDEDNTYNDSKADKNVDVDTDDNGANIDYDRQPIWEQTQQQQQQQTQPSQRQISEQQSQDAIGDIAAEENDENQSSWQVSKIEDEVKDSRPNMFIPRKMKRHNGAARLDDATNRYTRIKQERQQQEQSLQHQRHATAPLQTTIANGDNNSKDDGDSNFDSQEEYMSHYRAATSGVAKETNFQKSHYGRTNGNVSQPDSSEGRQQQSQPHQQHLMSSLQNSQASSEYSFNAKGNNNAVEGLKSNEQQNDQSGNREMEMETVAKTTPATAIATATTNTYEQDEENKRLSLFEREKSLRRNSKHYGHKIHKKKYKDYQHYYSAMMMRRQHPTMTTTVAAQTTTAEMTTSTPRTESPRKTATVTKLIKMDDTNRHGDEDNLRYHKKLKMERGKAVPPSPIFVLKSVRNGGDKATTMHGVSASNKPFYEGQINYYLETEDDDDARASEARFITKGDRMDTNNDWYRKLSPVLRNGVKTTVHQEDRASGSGMGRPTGGGYTPYHHIRNHHQKHHHHHQQHNQHNHHHHSRNHAYQRKMIPKKAMAATATTTPMPPPSRKHATTPEEPRVHELVHQITDLKEFERYYAKWPHLARVQSQLHDEQLREQLELQNLQKQQLGNYQDYEYDEDYFEAIRTPLGGNRDVVDNAEENLPPYIRKYNRRNKQLLDLLEGTLPPPTRPPQQLRWAGSKLQPGPRDSSGSVGSMSVRIDDDYLKEKRKRYHQRQKQIHDLFEQQRVTTSTTTTTPKTTTTIATMLVASPYAGSSSHRENDNASNNSEPELENHFPDEDVSVSMETEEEQAPNQDTNWQKEIASKSTSSSKSTKTRTTATGFSAFSSNTGNSPIPWQMEKLITPVAPATPKPAIFKLPSYPSIAGSYIQRPRSRSAQFAPSSGSEFRRVTPSIYGNSNQNNFINAGGFVAYNGHGLGPKSTTARFNGSQNKTIPTTILKPSTNISNTSKSNTSSSASSSSSTRSSSRSSSSPASVSNSFVYHRVVDASPRLVGAGLTGRKQRLPFVAITDRRLETSKKSLMDHQKDFEQNHYPLP
ncbi:putative mediator of RNA polymerase II transcription subunit 26 [Musca vetustissima]|uniref:putative mediator of RNA polymerase II transcription subunit 26 n=1 Tax=Musca vetustissima TaxID=27455 RepID=UPI002AB7EC2C|nr:putative mediator of RNA polymerase II transcription subunit 26 [Musca vetustissima]